MVSEQNLKKYEYDSFDYVVMRRVKERKSRYDYSVASFLNESDAEAFAKTADSYYVINLDELDD